MMEEWSDWVVEDSDPAKMIHKMRGVLADRRRSQDEKLEALTLLTNLADDASIEVLRWYHEHADPGMEIASMLALLEAGRLNEPPRVEKWHEELLECIQEVSEELSAAGIFPSRRHFREALARRLRERAWLVEENGQALLKYDGQVVDMVPVEMVVNGQLLIGFWDYEDEEEAWSEHEFEAGGIDPFDNFYAILRTSNLPWGVLVDISGEGVLTDVVQNIELDRGRPRVEYILAMGRYAA